MILFILYFHLIIFPCVFLQNELTVKEPDKKSTTREPNNIEHVLNETERPAWYKDALKDIAYALRSHKFNSFDVRYQRDGSTAPRTGFTSFPNPPLRSLHWEVHHFCDASFLSCVDYLRKKVRQMALKREDDSAVVMTDQKWTIQKNGKQIEQIDLECKRMKERDEKLGPPFEGPLERYQWLTTARYYLCWFTMNEVPDLEHLDDRCDNFGQCLDFTLGPTTNDPRADDTKPYGCALYSFCPDPCCANKQLTNVDLCWENADYNPCYSENPKGERQCELNRKENTEFTDLILNRWNVSCKCPRPGFSWSSKYGICVDVDECALSAKPVCSENGTACVNLPGSFRCICKWGFTLDTNLNKCVDNPAVQKIKLDSLKKRKFSESKFRRFMHTVLKLFAKSSGSIKNTSLSSVLLVSIVIFLYIF